MFKLPSSKQIITFLSYCLAVLLGFLAANYFDIWLGIIVFVVLIILIITQLPKYWKWQAKQETELHELRTQNLVIDENQVNPKVTKAEMLPTGQMRLEFDNDEVRYMNSPLEYTLTKNDELGNQLATAGTLGFMGNEFVISDDGSLTMNDKFKWSRQMLYQASREHYNK